MTQNPVPAGTWVQIRQQVLSPQERAPQVPADTAQVPLVLLAKGFLMQAARKGDTVQIRTLSDRILEGQLVEVLPRYSHDFGQAVPELLEIGPRVRSLLKGGKARD